MQRAIFKLSSFVCIFLFAQMALIPWAEQNINLPFWMSITLVTLFVCASMATVDHIGSKLFTARGNN